MKFFATSAIFLYSTILAAAVLPAGTYQGSGVVLTSNGGQTPFTITSVVQNLGRSSQVITDTYDMKGSRQSYRYQVETTGTTLVVSRNSVEQGSGYCVDSFCHIKYDFSDSEVSGEENFVVTGSTVERFGSRAHANGPTHYVHTTLRKIEKK